MRNIAIICSAIIGASLLSFPAIAQQKTVRACQEEWRANKADNQAKGITEKAYVAQCRAGGAAPTATTTTTTTKTTAAPPPAAGGQKTVRACQQEWRANKAANQAQGITEKAYVAQGRSGGTVAAPAPAPMPAPTRTTTAPTTAPPPPATTGARPATTTTAATGAYQYPSETQARFRCGSGTVVWANLNSKVYHFAGYKDYGNTKSGAYMCEQDASREGMRASKNEKHP
jgi:hypothetical protein